MLLLLKNILFTILVPGTVAFYIPLRIEGGVSSASLEWSPWKAVSVPLFVMGGAIYFWCLFDFALIGRGTPAPIDAPKNLVVHGVYRYVRNPMYLGILLIVTGWVIFFQSTDILIYLITVGLFFHMFVLLIEEPQLGRKFGESYSRYRKSVGRWIPRLGRRNAV